MSANVSMKVYTCTDFEGFWPVGVAAVIVATDADAAEAMLRLELDGLGLGGQDKITLREVETSQPSVAILSDGDY